MGRGGSPPKTSRTTRTPVSYDPPDVEWSCVNLDGKPVLVVQATGPHLSASLLGRKYEKVDVRITYDTDQLPKMVEDAFIAFADGQPFGMAGPGIVASGAVVTCVPALR